MKIADANIVLRYLLNDNEDLSNGTRARHHLKASVLVISKFTMPGDNYILENCYHCGNKGLLVPRKEPIS